MKCPSKNSQCSILATITRSRLTNFILLCGIFIIVFMGNEAHAQQTTGTPGSPGATTTIDGKQLPPPDPKFGGSNQRKCLAINSMVGATSSTS